MHKTRWKNVKTVVLSSWNRFRLDAQFRGSNRNFRKNHAMWRPSILENSVSSRYKPIAVEHKVKAKRAGKSWPWQWSMRSPAPPSCTATCLFGQWHSPGPVWPLRSANSSALPDFVDFRYLYFEILCCLWQKRLGAIWRVRTCKFQQKAQIAQEL